ncbi:MAG TPA: M23 family metallopeptidase [Jiangellales bacterium]|nr:M23 family metallopeptidase [Jiangellales bacterium]
MVPRKSTPRNLTIPAVLAGILTVGIAGPAAGATTDVAEAVKAAERATRTFEKAETSAKKSADALKSATAVTEKANDQLIDVRLHVLRTEADLERAREVLDRISTEVDQAFAITEELEPDGGIVDAAAKAAEVAAGDTDLPVLDAAADAAKAGLTAVIGPVLSLVKPISDAVSDEVEETDQQFAAAEARGQMLSQQRMAAIQDHRTASVAWSEATAQLKSAETALKDARAAERRAVEQDAEASQAAEKAEDAKAKAEAAQKKAKAAQQEEAAERAAAGRAEAAGVESRSATVSGRVRPGTGPITSDYGMRAHPVTGAYKLHSGTDFGYGDGSAYAAAAGTVTSVTYDGAYGNMVTVDHGGGTETRYAHLSGASVSSGQQVSAGQKVGNIGATGYATGPHLHFEVLIGGDFVNPLGWLGG